MSQAHYHNSRAHLFIDDEAVGDNDFEEGDSGNGMLYLSINVRFPLAN